MRYYTHRLAQIWKQNLANRHGKPVWIALDAHGGDKGISTNVSAAVEAVSTMPNLGVVLVGDGNKILYEMDKKKFRPPEIKIHHAPDSVSMNDLLVKIARDDSNSIVQGLKLHQSGKVDGFVSVGNTGAIMVSAHIHLKPINGIERTPLLAPFPTMARHSMAVLDVGANVDCRPEHLAQFALMGSQYAKFILGIENPRVALLSIGEEPVKGNAQIKRTYEILASTSNINFVGNIEGHNILTGQADVIVCDGFVGNIILKYTESIYSLVRLLFRKGRRLSILSIIGGFLLYPSLKRTLGDFNYAEYGGAPLLGVKGNVVIGHGRSSVKAIKNAILVAQMMALTNLPKQLESALANIGNRYENKNIRTGSVNSTGNSN